MNRKGESDADTLALSRVPGADLSIINRKMREYYWRDATKITEAASIINTATR